MDATIGTEHMVELDTHTGLVGKTTLPPGFGLVPAVRQHSLAVLRPEAGGPVAAESIEFVSATPLEYLSRWLANNEVFGVLAIDAETRNCYINRGGLQPFDVIVCEPDEALERYLRIYPR